MLNPERGDYRTPYGVLRLTVEACIGLEADAGASIYALIDQANQGSVTAVRWTTQASSYP